MFVANQMTSAIFQAGGLVVILIEVMRKAYLASIVPVIVNAILNGHQLVVDIIAFVSRGDFPRSRLGEKQRGKILASWVTRKMRTIAQFGIRDSDQVDAQMNEVASTPPHRAASTRNGSLVASSVGHVQISPGRTETMQSDLHLQTDYPPIPAGISEMPTEYDGIGIDDQRYSVMDRNGNGKSSPAEDDTPTTSTSTADVHASHFELPDTSLGEPTPTPANPTGLKTGPSSGFYSPPLSAPPPPPEKDPASECNAYPLRPNTTEQQQQQGNIPSRREEQAQNMKLPHLLPRIHQEMEMAMKMAGGIFGLCPLRNLLFLPSNSSNTEVDFGP